MIRKIAWPFLKKDFRVTTIANKKIENFWKYPGNIWNVCNLLVPRSTMPLHSESIRIRLDLHCRNFRKLQA